MANLNLLKLLRASELVKLSKIWASDESLSNPSVCQKLRVQAPDSNSGVKGPQNNLQFYPGFMYI